MTEMNCPKCQSPMVLRTAKKGKHKGNQFWGCTRYPHCREIVDYDPKEGVEESVQIPQEFPNTSRPIVITRRFEAKAPDNLQTFYYESATIPKPIFEKIQADRLDEKNVRNFAQWRMDFSPGGIIPDRTLLEEQIISVLEKILTRGRITFPAPELEKEILKKIDGEDHDVDTLNSIFLFPSNPLSEELFDSNEEKIFLTECVIPSLGEDYLKWIIPQVSLSCLLAFLPDGITGRVDFLLSHPILDRSVVIEIDGKQHDKSIVEDRNRDEVLTKAGFDVIRIPASEVRQVNGESIDQIKSFLEQIRNHEEGLNRTWNILNGTKLCHQIQLCLTAAMKAGLHNFTDASEPEVKTDLTETQIFNKARAKGLVRRAVKDFMQLVQNLRKLYGVIDPGENDSPVNTDIRIYFMNRDDMDEGAFHVQDIYLPFSLKRNVVSSTPQYLSEPQEKDLQYFLNYLFRKENFWEGQFNTCSRLLQGLDTILLLPTGAGKSIAFQLAGILLPGVTIVVAPIISLINDQIENLRSVGIERCMGISSQIDDPNLKEEVVDLFGQGEYLFTYIAPERFQIDGFRRAVKALTTSTPVSLIVVDEAHCVSEWGHDFRTSYLNLGKVGRELCRMNGNVPPLVAMTGTASRAVLKDVQRELDILDFEAIITPESFDRKELRFDIKLCNTSEKKDVLRSLLTQVLPGKFGASESTFYQNRGASTYSGLIFCPHVNGDHGVVQISKFLRDRLKIGADFYSGNAPKGIDYKTHNYRKQEVARKFKRDEIPLLVCTKAFGMGIDKPNIRYTIHYNLPPSIESFYQECGRAGRDRKMSQCVLIVSDDHPEKNRRLLHVDTPISVVMESKTERGEADDIDRNLFFQTNSFPGVEEEMKNLKDTISKFANIRDRSTQTIAYAENSEMRIAEKGIHRLVVLGVVADYMVDFSGNAITAIFSGADREKVIDSYTQYIEGYSDRRAKTERETIIEFQDDNSADLILKIAERLLAFLYDVIERGRRRAMEEMLDAAKTRSEDSLRSRILQYLEQTEFSPILESLVEEEIEIIEALQEAFEFVVSHQKASELRGQSSRYLESYPDNPGLLLLRGLSEYRCRDRDFETVQTNIIAAINFAREKYGVEEEEVVDLLVWTLGRFDSKDVDVVNSIVLQVLSVDQDHVFIDGRAFARRLIDDLQIELCVLPATYLMGLTLIELKNLQVITGE